MHTQIDFISMVQSRESSQEFTRTFANEIASRIETGPTRGGQVAGQALLGNSSGVLVWVIVSDTVGGGSWLENRIKPGVDALAEVATIFRQSTFQLNHAEVGDDVSALAGIGPQGGLVRIYKLESEQADATGLLAAINQVELHPANRIGHSTDAVALLSQVEGALPEDSHHFKLLISHQVYESFKHKNTFEGDIRTAITEISALAVINSFDEFEILLRL